MHREPSPAHPWAEKVSTIFTRLKNKAKKKKGNPISSHTKFTFPCPWMKSCGSTVTLLWIIYDSAHTTVAELSSGFRDPMDHKAWDIYSLPLYRKSLLMTPALELGFLIIWESFSFILSANTEWALNITRKHLSILENSSEWNSLCCLGASIFWAGNIQAHIDRYIGYIVWW